MGEPPLVTPSSQIVGTQAVMNVLTGKRYMVVPQETKDIFLGRYGKCIKPFNEEIQKQVIGNEEPITCRPADLLEPKLQEYEEKIKAYKQQDEDVLTYALFPEVAMDYFKYQAKRHSCDEYLAFDTTSISSYSTLIKQAKYGKNKEGDSLPQIKSIHLPRAE